MNTNQWLTMADYAETMKMSVSKVKRMKLNNELPFVQEGSIVRIPPQATDFLWLSNWRQEQIGAHQ